MKRSIGAGLVILLLVTLMLPSSIFANSAVDDMKKENQFVEQAIQSVQSGNIKAAQEKIDSFSSTWLSVEDGIKKQSMQAYRDIEDAMGQVQFAFAQQPVDKNTLLTNLEQLEQVNEKFIAGQFPTESSADKAPKADQGNIAGLVSLIDQAIVKVKKNDIQGAKGDVEKVRSMWLDVEGIVLTQSSKVYADAEKDMVTSYALLSSNPPKKAEAEKTLQTMRDYLAPLGAKTSYTLVDAVTILLREGLEGLLVVVALLGFLKKAGHEDKKKWIFYGVGAGFAVSIILGMIVQMLFSAGTFGNNNFLIAGWTGLFAAVMLLYMSYWLHSKSSTAQWQEYIRNQSTKALATGSLMSLAILSFLAVFREGTETVLFYIGMASSISLTSLVTGIGIGLLTLVILSYLILKVGLKIPMRPFFIVSSILVFYLCFKFLGMGIHGLQLAGLLPATQASGLPAIESFAIYPTWESILPQAILLTAAIATVIWNKRKDSKINQKLQTNKAS